MDTNKQQISTNTAPYKMFVQSKGSVEINPKTMQIRGKYIENDCNRHIAANKDDGDTRQVGLDEMDDRACVLLALQRIHMLSYAWICRFVGTSAARNHTAYDDVRGNVNQMVILLCALPYPILMFFSGG